MAWWWWDVTMGYGSEEHDGDWGSGGCSGRGNKGCDAWKTEWHIKQRIQKLETMVRMYGWPTNTGNWDSTREQKKLNIATGCNNKDQMIGTQFCTHNGSQPPCNLLTLNIWCKLFNTLIHSLLISPLKSQKNLHLCTLEEIFNQQLNCSVHHQAIKPPDHHS